jgi:hypothetical protein
MSTSKTTITDWIERAKKEDARWLIVVCDSYDHSDYPISFKENQLDECLQKISDTKQGLSMQRLMEVYDLKKPIEAQLNAHRAMEIPEKFSTTDNSKDTKTVSQQAIFSFMPIIKEEIDKYTDEQRLKLFSHYCKHCGSKDPKCKCWNDE